MTGEQGKAGAWVERAIWLADEMADKAGACEAGEFVAKQRAALRSHLTAHAQAESAVRGALLEALCALVLNHDAGGVTMGAMADARAAIALARAGEGKV